MKKQITIMLAMILALPLVLAMYGGESKIIPFNFETDNCTIVPNVTDGINFTFNNHNVLVEPAINFVGEFNITCYDWLTKEEETYTGESFPSESAIRSSPLILNVTEDNETIDYVEPQKDIDKVIEEPIIDEPKSRNWWIMGIAVVIIILLIILIIWFVMNKSEEEFEEENNDDEITL